MIKKQGQQKARKSTEIRRVEILDAAMNILALEGPRQFTAERLGAAVGMASGSIFRHFGSMDEILDGVVDRIEQIIFAGFPPERGNPLERLRTFFESRVQAVREHPEISKLLITDALIPSGLTGSREKRLRLFKKRSRTFVINSLKEAKELGMLDSDVSHEEGSVLVLGAIYAVGHLGITVDRGCSDTEMIKRIWRLLEKSLSKRLSGNPVT